MSGFVLDASVAAAWCFADETTPESDALRESLTEQRAVVPRLWNVLRITVLTDVACPKRGKAPLFGDQEV